MTSGVLTMAYGPSTYIRMAKGLSRSIRLHNPDTQVAIVTDRSPASLRRWFDVIVPFNPAYGPGLAQKLHLDLYSPFQQTLYVDSDFLLFDDLTIVWDRFRGSQGFSVIGYHLSPGEDHYAIDDLPRFMESLGISKMVMTNTGIMYFDRSGLARQAFELARTICGDATSLGVRRHPAGFFNDEPIFGSVVELLGLPFASNTEDHGGAASGRTILALASFGTGSMSDIDVRRVGRQAPDLGAEPVAVHFNVESQRSQLYDRELRRLEYGSRLGRTAVPDLVTTAKWGVRGLVRRSGQWWRSLTQKVRAVARRAPYGLRLLDGLPYSLVSRRTDVSPGVLLRQAAERSPTPFTFIQVGSNDGQTGDPLFETVVRTAVKGLLIEPIPELFDRLRATYAGADGLSFVRAAIAAEEGDREFYWVRRRPGDPVWVDQLGSFSPEVVLSHFEEVPDIAERLESLSVPCRTLSSLVIEHRLTRLDLLHIDAEGSDFAILKSVDFEAPWSPRFLLYEQKHLGPDRTGAVEFLHGHGYTTIDLGADVFAFRGFAARFLRLGRRSRSRV